MSSCVEAFWRWFLAHNQEVRQAYESGNTNWLNSELSNRVNWIARNASWEIGPYCLPDSTLVLSPGNRAELPTVKSAVACAPAVRGWHFIACKPPKDLVSLIFELENTSTNADSWAYRMTLYNDGEFADLELFFEESSSPPLGKEATLCEIIVEALLGEELRLDRIGVITPVCVTDVDAVANTSAIKHLRSQVLEVLTPWSSDS